MGGNRGSRNPGDTPTRKAGIFRLRNSSAENFNLNLDSNSKESEDDKRRLATYISPDQLNKKKRSFDEITEESAGCEKYKYPNTAKKTDTIAIAAQEGACPAPTLRQNPRGSLWRKLKPSNTK